MTVHAHTYRGVVHGKTIQRDDETGWPDGQQVTITVQPVSGTEVLVGRLPPGE